MQNQNQNNNKNNNNNQNNPPGFDMLTRFLRLRPAKFSGTTDPMVSNDWLRSVNKDLVRVRCTDEGNVRFLAHLLEGPTTTWWGTFQITTPIEEVTWAMLKMNYALLLSLQDDVDTDAKRKEKFLEGLNDEMCMELSVAYVPTYQSLCDKAMILESKMKQVENR